MPQRIVNVWSVVLAVVGLCAIGAIVLARRDARLMAATGPRWQRRLLTAGLALLGLSTLAGCRDKKAPRSPHVSCYQVMPTTTAPVSAEDFAARLDLLEEQIAAGMVQPAVLESRLNDLAEQARTQAIEKAKKNHTDPEAAKTAVDPLVAAEQRASQLWARVHAGDSPLGRSDDWQAVLAFWHFTQPLADSQVSTLKQRAVADEMHAAAKDALKKLADAKLLDPAECELLTIESETLRARMAAKIPVDWMVTCYMPLLIIPAQESLTRLSARADLLEAALKDGKLEPAVAERVLGTIKADLAVLGDAEQTAQLDSRKRAEAQKVRTRVAGLVGQASGAGGAPAPKEAV